MSLSNFYNYISRNANIKKAGQLPRFKFKILNKIRMSFEVGLMKL